MDRAVKGYYNCDYVGYQQKGNPDFINRLKNMTKSHNEMDLVKDFIEVAERATNDLKHIIENEGLFQLFVLLRVQGLKNHISIANSCLKKQFLVWLIILTQ